MQESLPSCLRRLRTGSQRCANSTSLNHIRHSDVFRLQTLLLKDGTKSGSSISYYHGSRRAKMKAQEVALSKICQKSFLCRNCHIPCIVLITVVAFIFVTCHSSIRYYKQVYSACTNDCFANQFYQQLDLSPCNFLV